MNGAELKTIRQSIGYSTEDFARCIGVQPRSVQRWEDESYLVPGFAIEKIDELHWLFLQCNFENQQILKSLKRPILIRYKKADARYLSMKFSEGVSVSDGFFSALTARAIDFVKLNNIDYDVIYFSSDEYEKFLRKENSHDSPEMRQKWARWHVDCLKNKAPDT